MLSSIPFLMVPSGITCLNVPLPGPIRDGAACGGAGGLRLRLRCQVPHRPPSASPLARRTKQTYSRLRPRDLHCTRSLARCFSGTDKAGMKGRLSQLCTGRVFRDMHSFLILVSKSQGSPWKERAPYELISSTSCNFWLKGNTDKKFCMCKMRY